MFGGSSHARDRGTVTTVGTRELVPGRWIVTASRLTAGRAVLVVQLRVRRPDGHTEVFHGRTRPLEMVPVSQLSPRWWAAFAHVASRQLEHAYRHDMVDYLPTDAGYPTVVVRYTLIRRGAFVPLDTDDEVTIHHFDIAATTPASITPPT